MARLGFVLDQRSCIGCHACTVACKQEHGVELGVFRTWVKYIEEGTFPDARRSFSVMRCNQCDDAPCVRACPTTALFRDANGIVDFDNDRCIGCKACMNACPYDALYIDPQSQTAAKCNFCAHRIAEDRRPSCEVVCPTNAIISGDLDDPASQISRLLATVPSTVRAPEQKTQPKVFYLGASEASLDPLAATDARAYLNEYSQQRRRNLQPLAGQAQARLVADASDHPAPWGWRVSSYFLTKGVAAGAMMLCALLAMVGAAGSALADVVPGVLALAGIALTGVFLVSDLKRPERFWYLFVHPQRRSWLALGAYVINVAALAAAAFTVTAIIGADGARDVLGWALIPVGAALAGYTAFLFNQMEGRDLWQSRLLLPLTLVNALVAGAGALAIAAIAVDAPAAIGDALAWTLLVAGAAALALIVADTFGAHPTRQAERAARNLRRDLFAARFWSGTVLATALPAVCAAVFLVVGGPLLLGAGGAGALVGLWLYEDAWVRAGQSVPLS